MPAPAVIPAPIVYFKVVAVKTLVVYLKGACRGSITPTLNILVEFLDRGIGCLRLSWGIFQLQVFWLFIGSVNAE